MKAEDTVQSNGALLKYFGTPDFTERQGRERQAEISFKAGQEDKIADYGRQFLRGEDKGKKEGSLVGIRKVVEWIMANDYSWPITCDEEWQAQLKKWGIE